MINPIVNNQERRMRALLRLAVFVFISFFILSIPALIPSKGVEYVVRVLLCLGFYYIMIRFVDLRSWKESGLITDKIWFRECGTGIAIAAAAMGIIFFTEWITGGLEITGFGWQRSSASFWLWPVLLFFVQMTAVGVYEEIISRGYILRNLAEGFSIKEINPKTGTIMAVLVSSVLFGLAHIANPNITWMAIFNIFLAGVMLAVPFVITGRLGFSIGIHMSWNFFQGGIFGFRVSGIEVRNSVIQVKQFGPDFWTGGAFGPEGGLAGVFGIVLVLVFTVLYLRKKGINIALAPSFQKSFLQKKQSVE